MALQRSGIFTFRNGVEIFFGVEWDDYNIGLRSKKYIGENWVDMAAKAGVVAPNGTRPTAKHWTFAYHGPLYTKGQSFDPDGSMGPLPQKAGDLIEYANEHGIAAMVTNHFDEHDWLVANDPDLQAAASTPPPTQGTYTTAQQVGADLMSFLNGKVGYGPDGKLTRLA